MPEQKPELAHHLEVERGALAQPLGLQHHALLLELRRRARSISASMSTMAALELLRGRDVVRGGIDVELLALGEHLAR